MRLGLSPAPHSPQDLPEIQQQPGKGTGMTWEASSNLRLTQPVDSSSLPALPLPALPQLQQLPRLSHSHRRQIWAMLSAPPLGSTLPMLSAYRLGSTLPMLAAPRPGSALPMLSAPRLGSTLAMLSAYRLGSALPMLPALSLPHTASSTPGCT